MIAYFDCFSGVSGNMLLGALLDAGYPEASLRATLASLPVHGYTPSVKRQSFQGFAATQVVVDCVEAGHHHHAHRHLADITRLLAEAPLDEGIRQRALAVFKGLAEAEAAVHGTAVEAVHFHEVGAVDAIVDIVGVVAGCAHLGITRVHCSPLPLTSGWVRCAHGDIPLPGPAVCRLLDGVPVYGVDLHQELVTPTGAALLRALVDEFGPAPPMRLGQTGYGAGTTQRSDGRPNLLRLMLGESLEVTEAQQVEVIETHLDDWNPEFWPYVSGLLMEAGALDVCLVPMQMKKGRPGFLLRVIGEPAQRPLLTDLILAETTAIGLRIRREERVTLPRQIITVATPWGAVPAKQIITAKGNIITPEYEACQQVARTHQVPLRDVYAAVSQASTDKAR